MCDGVRPRTVYEQNRRLTLKGHQKFTTVHTTLDNFKNSTIAGHFGFVFNENAVTGIT